MMMTLTETQIKNVIKSMKCNKAPGIDEFTTEILKEIADYITAP